MPLPAGTRLGPYEIRSFIGAGGMGEVYEGRDTRLDRGVAIKVLPLAVASTPDRLARFEREARAAAALNHPNICAVFDVGTHEGTSFIVSELLEGHNLRELYGEGPLPVRRVVDLAAQIARGLAVAHARGIVHRDLKPENIFVTPEGQVKILDFGLAKLVEEARSDEETTVAGNRHITEVGQVLGTVGYMSPEQIRGQETDSRSDIFSFGTVLFEMVTGRRPFRGDTAADTSSAILREDPPSDISASGAPPVLERIIRRCLEKRPQARFQSAADLAFALEAVSTAPTSGGLTATDERPASKRLRIAAIAAGIILVLVALAAVLLATREPTIDSSAFRFSPLATGAGFESNAVWSPDGRSLAYWRTIAGYDQLFVRALDLESPAIQMTRGPSNSVPAFWWPDSSRIGFLSSGSVFSVSRAGGPPEILQKDDTIGAADLSPDGKTLATWRISGQGGAATSGVWLASPPNAAPRKYEPAPFEVSGAVGPNRLYFSPDGKQLLLAHAIPSSAVEVWLLPMPGGNNAAPRRIRFDALPDNSVEVPKFSWMPDSAHVVMSLASQAAPKGGLWIADTRTGHSSLLSAGVTGQHSPSVSPEGSQLAFTSGSPDVDIVELPMDGGPPREMLATSELEHSPAWISSGGRFVYVSERNGTQELRAYSPSDGRDQSVVSAAAFGKDKIFIGAPTPAPDGQRVAYFVLDATAGVFVWISPIGGGAPVRLTNDKNSEAGPEWSPDGESIAYFSIGAGDVTLRIARVGRNEPPRDVKAPGLRDGSLSPPAWSPDGQWIGYATSTGLRLVSPDSLRTRVLSPMEHAGLAWSRDGRTLYTTRRIDDGTIQFRAINVASGAIRTISTLGAGYELAVPYTPGLRFTLGRDGNSVLTSNIRYTNDIWILENFIPKRGLMDRWRSFWSAR